MRVRGTLESTRRGFSLDVQTTDPESLPNVVAVSGSLEDREEFRCLLTGRPLHFNPDPAMWAKCFESQSCHDVLVVSPTLAPADNPDGENVYYRYTENGVVVEIAPGHTSAWLARALQMP